MAKDEGGSFDPVPEGMHHAVCYGVYDLGTQYSEKFDSHAHKMLIQWEIPGERIDVERDGVKMNLPRAISKIYTVSLNEKANLRKDLQAWRGKAFTETELKGFDLKNILGKNCMLQVIHNQKDNKTYANITTLTPLPKGSTPLKAENPLRFYSINDHRGAIPEGTPEWVENIIKAGDEWASMGNGSQYVPDDDVPF